MLNVRHSITLVADPKPSPGWAVSVRTYTFSDTLDVDQDDVEWWSSWTPARDLESALAAVPALVRVGQEVVAARHP